jgi:hypothetical protein
MGIRRELEFWMIRPGVAALSEPLFVQADAPPAAHIAL